MTRLRLISPSLFSNLRIDIPEAVKLPWCYTWTVDREIRGVFIITEVKSHNPPELYFPRPTGFLTVYTYASDFQIGYVLLQKQMEDRG